MRLRLRAASVVLGLLLLTVSIGCGGEHSESSRSDEYKAVTKAAKSRKAYLPHNGVELSNYNSAQKLYDSPTTIIWCTTTWGNANSPMVTVPIAGKLTSSSVSYFPNQVVRSYSSDDSGDYNPELRSVDGMFHGNPPPYRYGFTPGGQYVDFFNMPTLCTTALTKFQRQQTRVALSVDPAAAKADREAQKALARGDKAAAQRILEQAIGG